MLVMMPGVPSGNRLFTSSLWTSLGRQTQPDFSPGKTLQFPREPPLLWTPFHCPLSGYFITVNICLSTIRYVQGTVLSLLQAWFLCLPYSLSGSYHCDLTHFTLRKLRLYKFKLICPRSHKLKVTFKPIKSANGVDKRWKAEISPGYP